MLIHKEFLAREEWEAGMKMLDRPFNWEQLSTTVLVSQSLPHIPQWLLEEDSQWHSKELKRLQDNVVLDNRHYSVRGIPIRDVRDRQVATLLIMQDISAIHAELKMAIIIVDSIFGIIGFSILFFFYNLLGRTENELVSARQKIIDEGKVKQEMQAKFIEKLQFEHEKLRVSEERFEKISATAQDAIISVDSKGNIVYWNIAAEKIFGYTQQQASGLHLYQLIAPLAESDGFVEERSGYQQSDWKMLAGKTLELKGIDQKGGEFPVELSLSSTTVNNEWTGVGILRDITDRKRSQLEVQRALYVQRVLDTILNISLPTLNLDKVLLKALDAILAIPSFSLLNKGAIFLVADDGQILNLVAQRNLPGKLLTKCAKLALGQCLCGKAAASRELIFSSHIDERHEIRTEDMQAHGHYCVPIVSDHKLLGVLNIYIASGHHSDEEEKSYLKTVADTLAVVIERKKDEQALKQLAHHDVLTGLPNRTLFYDRLEQTLARAIRQKEGFMVFFLDLDHFKEINDTLGHNAGDKVLQQATKRIKGCVKRKIDTIARMGGDEFTIILSKAEDIQKAGKIAQCVIDSIAQPFVLDGKEYRLGCSIGIAQYPLHGEDCHSLVRHADEAMYMAKKQRNTYSLYAPNEEEGL